MCTAIIEVQSFVDVHSRLSHLSAPVALHQRSSSSTLSEVKAECAEIGQKLTGFIDAWHLIHIACNDLLLRVERVDSLAVSRSHWCNTDKIC